MPWGVSMPLAEQLATARDAVRAALPARIFDAIGASVGSLNEDGLAGRAVGVGSHVALPVLETVDGSSVDLLVTAAGRPVVLVFYRGGWCPYCNATLRAYAQILPAIEAAGAALIAVTPETAGHASVTTRDNDVRFPVAIDKGNRFARSLGLVFAVADDLVPLYREIGIDVADRNGAADHELPIPATYVLDPAGRVAWAHVDADFTTRAEPGEALAAVRTLADRGR